MSIPLPLDTNLVSSPDPVALTLRAVHRAASELRRGTPVLLRGPGQTGTGQALLIAAAETVGAHGLAGEGGRVDLSALMRELAQRGTSEVLLEAGAGLVGAFAPVSYTHLTLPTN